MPSLARKAARRPPEQYMTPNGTKHYAILLEHAREENMIIHGSCVPNLLDMELPMWYIFDHEIVFP